MSRRSLAKTEVAPGALARWPGPTLAALTGLNLLNYLDRYVLPALVSPIERDLGLTDGEFGFVATAFMLGYFLTSPFFGWLGDRLPRRWLVAAGVLVWSVGTVLTGRAHGLISLLLFRVVVGVGEASYGTISPGWIADLFSPPRRSVALAVFYVAIPVGSALGFIVGGAVAAHWGWRAAFLCAGAPGIFLALGMLAFPEPARGANEGEGQAAAAGPSRGFWRDYASLARRPAYCLVVAGYAAQTFAMGGFGTWAAAFLQRTHHMRLVEADRFFGIALVTTGLTATLAGGWLAAAWRRRSRAGPAWVLGLSALAAAPAAFAAFTLQNPAFAKVALAATMFLLFLPVGPVNALILETVPVAMRARAMAASIFAIHLGGDLWSPQIVGFLSGRWGDLQKAALWTLPVAIVLCAFFWLWLAAGYSRPASTSSMARS